MNSTFTGKKIDRNIQKAIDAIDANDFDSFKACIKNIAYDAIIKSGLINYLVALDYSDYIHSLLNHVSDYLKIDTYELIKDLFNSDAINKNAENYIVTLIHNQRNRAIPEDFYVMAIDTDNLDLAFKLLTIIKTEQLDLQPKLDSNVLFLRAVKAGNIAVVKKLMYERHSFNINIDFADKFKMTALHYAAQSGHAYIVNYLLEYVSDASLTSKSSSKYNNTPAEIAKCNGHIQIANSINETIFWRMYNDERSKAFCGGISNLPVNANIAEILGHATKGVSRSRDICVKLGWMDEKGSIQSNIRSLPFDFHTKAEVTFWGRYTKDLSLLSISNLPKDATLAEILHHAKTPNTRTRKICLDMGIIKLENDKVVLTDEIQFDYDTEEKCKAAFLDLHNRLCQRQFFRPTSQITKDSDLATIIKHAMNNNTRSREVCVILGWMDENGGMGEKVPPAVAEIFIQNSNPCKSKSRQ